MVHACKSNSWTPPQNLMFPYIEKEVAFLKILFLPTFFSLEAIVRKIEMLKHFELSKKFRNLPRQVIA